MQVVKLQKPFALCMTGISGSGKSTIANAVAKFLAEMNIYIQVLDGDETRELAGELFGHSREERGKMARVNRTIGYYLIRANVPFILAVVAPFEEIRLQFRDFFGDSYVEIYVKASVETCADRDVKGLYKRNREAKLANFNGCSDVFEVPSSSDIVIDTETQNLTESVDATIKGLIDLGYLRVEEYER